MLNINNFEIPTQHPYGMLQGYSHASEKEEVLASLLIWGHTKNDLFAPKEFIHSHPTMVKDGLLEQVKGTTYKLTTKSVKLLYSVYGKGS